MGVAMGTLTGIIPGFHVNNVALILLALAPALLSIGIPLSAVAGIIVSTGTVHTFLNYIPSALMGAPDADQALSFYQVTECYSLEMLHEESLGLLAGHNSDCFSPSR